MHKTWIEIFPSALLHNYRQISKILKPEVKLMAVLKSNAYGHGILEVAEILVKNQRKFKNELWLGVDSLIEAKRLGDLSRAKNIPMVMLGYALNDDLKQTPPNTRLTVYNFETIKALKKINKKFKVHVKVETGTQRQGIGVGDLPDFIKELKKAKNIEIEGVSSHFARAEDISSPTFTLKQYKLFYDASKLAEKLTGKKLLKHIACSAAISHWPKSHFDMVRTGINLYGLQSINMKALKHENIKTRTLNLQPVLSWKTIVAQVKDAKKGMPVGYGRTEAMPYDGQIAVLPVGYWDGYDRRLGSTDSNNNSHAAQFVRLRRTGQSDARWTGANNSHASHLAGLPVPLKRDSLGSGQVLIGGQKCKIIGRVCMNICMALLPPGLKVRVEDEAVLIGKQGNEEVTADELAQKMGTVNYEIVTRINPLIPRLVV